MSAGNLPRVKGSPAGISVSYTHLDVYKRQVLEVTDHLADGIALADVGQELVAQACALGSGALHQTGDVDELNGGREDASLSLIHI